jgi:hypothetical protein
MNSSRSVDERNMLAKAFVKECYADIVANPITANEIGSADMEIGILERLIPIKQMGFRGIVLTAIVGKHLDPSFDPIENFYQCHPRSIFEKGIFYALQECGIPCGKSDPLNVAKNANKLDDAWASGRRPETAALAAVEYMRLLNQQWDDEHRRNRLIRIYFSKLNDFADLVRSKNVSVGSLEGTISIDTASKLGDFVVNCPEGGAIPQYVVGCIIRILRQNDSLYGSVGGVEESVFGTNTTSKKPADIWETLSDRSYGGLYEVTVKTIDKKRLDDCVDALSALSISNLEITFICNLPNDTLSLGNIGNSLEHRGVGFQFIDIRLFILTVFILLTQVQQDQVVNAVQEFVHDNNRHIKTKDYWSENFVSN